MTRPTQNLGDLFREEEDRLSAITRRQLDEERAAWDALSPEEQAKRRAESIRKFDANFEDDNEHIDLNVCWDCGEVIDPDDDDGEGYCPDCRTDHEEDDEC